jgi:hypothetical protein
MSGQRALGGTVEIGSTPQLLCLPEQVKNAAIRTIDAEGLTG